MSIIPTDLITKPVNVNSMKGFDICWFLAFFGAADTERIYIELIAHELQ